MPRNRNLFRTISIVLFTCIINLQSVYTATQETPLHIAARDNKTEEIEKLIKAGAEKNAKDSDGQTPLHIAARHNNTEAIEKLIKLNADKNAKDKFGWTPLHIAASFDKAEAVKTLIILEADIRPKDLYGYTPLYWAEKRNCNNIVAIFVKFGALEHSSIQVNQARPMHTQATQTPSDWDNLNANDSAENKQEAEVIEDEIESTPILKKEDLLLILNKSWTRQELFKFDERGYTLLHKAVEYDNMNEVQAIFEQVLKYGPNAFVQITTARQNSNTPFTMIKSAAMMKLFLEQATLLGKDAFVKIVTTPDRSGLPKLSEAAWREFLSPQDVRFEFIKLILTHSRQLGEDVFIKVVNVKWSNMTPFSDLAWRGRLEVFKYFLDQVRLLGSSAFLKMVNVKDSSMSPYQDVKWRGPEKLEELLRQAKLLGVEKDLI